MPTFESDILKNSNYSSIILSLFDDSNIKLSKIHFQNKELKIINFIWILDLIEICFIVVAIIKVWMIYQLHNFRVHTGYHAFQ